MINRQWTLAMVTCFTAAAMLVGRAKAETDLAVRTIACGFYVKINQTEQQQQGVLDCRRESVALKDAYQLGGYSAKPKILIPVIRPDWDGRPVWTLSPPLQGAEAVNSLPPEALEDGLAGAINWTDALSLRRLRQTPSLDLTALARVPRLSHLELAETNAACLRPGLFSGELADRLLSLRLSDNLDLACIQPGALEPLKRLVEFRILGSPRLKTLGGAPALPSLTRLEILPRSTGNLESLSVPVSPIANSTFCRIGESLRHLAMDSELPLRYASVLLPSLAGLASLRVTPPQGESPEATVQRFVAHRQAAMCALWPRGDLRLNGILLTVWVADQLSMEYEEFCATSTDALEEFDVQANQLCSTPSWMRNATTDRGDNEHPDQDVCSDACPLLTTPPQSTTTTSPTPKRPQPKPIEASENSAARGNSEEGSNSVNWERQGIIGTVLLTSGAFVGGALIAAYCCHSRRRMAAAARLKLAGGVVVVAGGRRSSSVTVTSGAHSATSAAGSTAAAAERGEQIRLIGFSGALDGGTRLVVLKETEEEVEETGADTRPATEKEEAEEELTAEQWHDNMVDESRDGETGGWRREEDDEDEGMGTLLTAEL